MDSMSGRSGLVSPMDAIRERRLPVEPAVWLLLFAIASDVAGLPQFTPTVPGTELRLIWFPFAWLIIAFTLRPIGEAPFYALIYAAASLAAEPHFDHWRFAGARILLEIFQAAFLIFVFHARAYRMLNYPIQIFGYQLIVLGIFAVGALATVAVAGLPSIAASAIREEMAGNPVLAWRHWWLGNSCAYLTVAGPIGYLILLRHRIAAKFRSDPGEARQFMAMAASLFVSALLFLPAFDLRFLRVAPDLHLALMFIPAPIAFAMAACFRGHGSAAAMLILTPLAMMSAGGPHAGPHWSGLPPMATPLHVFLIITAIGCNVIAAITHRYQRALDDALSASQAKTRFVAMLNHELRTPLNAILGFSELMRVKNIRDMDEAIGPIENIHASGQRLMAMIEGLLNQADRGAGVFEIHRQQVNVRQAIEETVDEMQPLGGCGCGVTVRAADDISIDADPKALKQILLVLLSYSARFCGPEAKVEVVVERAGTDTVVEIAASGLINALADDRDKIEMQLVTAIALAHGARLAMRQQSRDRRVVRLTFFATHAH